MTQNLTEDSLPHALSELFPGTRESKWNKICCEIFDQGALPFSAIYKGNSFEWYAAALLGILKEENIPSVGKLPRMDDIWQIAKTLSVAISFKDSDKYAGAAERSLSRVFGAVTSYEPSPSSQPSFIFTDDSNRLLSTVQDLANDQSSDVYRGQCQLPLIVQVPIKGEWRKFDPEWDEMKSLTDSYAYALKARAPLEKLMMPNLRQTETIEFSCNGQTYKAEKKFFEGDTNTIQFFIRTNAAPDFSFLSPDGSGGNNVPQSWYLPHLIFARTIPSHLAFALRKPSKVTSESKKENTAVPNPYAQESIFSGGQSPHPESMAMYPIKGTSIQDRLLDEKALNRFEKAKKAIWELLGIDENLVIQNSTQDRYGIRASHLKFLVEHLVDMVAIAYAQGPRKREMHVIAEAIESYQTPAGSLSPQG